MCRVTHGARANIPPANARAMSPIVPKYAAGVASGVPWMTWAAIALPADGARNHSAIACPRKALGASSVVAARPTGDRHSSPTVWMT